MNISRNDADSTIVMDVADHEKQPSLLLPVILLILAILYDVSPVDIVPDIPIVGYIDDFFITATALLHFLQKWMEGTSLVLAGMLKWLKWAVVFIGMIAVSLVGLAAYGIVKLIFSI
ncbi:MAG: DUF1232 domain-containing protein [Deltaproteobacteria bacterium]|nr:DUF1232 domain-containing protein [Deltaproteobacteria bacterium]